MKVYTKKELDELNLDGITEGWISYYPTEIHEKNNSMAWSPLSEIKLMREWNAKMKELRWKQFVAMIWGK